MMIKILNKWPRRKSRLEVVNEVSSFEWNDEFDDTPEVALTRIEGYGVNDTVIYLEGEEEVKDLIAALQECVAQWPELTKKARGDFTKAQARRERARVKAEKAES